MPDPTQELDQLHKDFLHFGTLHSYYKHIQSTEDNTISIKQKDYNLDQILYLMMIIINYTLEHIII